MKVFSSEVKKRNAQGLAFRERISVLVWIAGVEVRNVAGAEARNSGSDQVSIGTYDQNHTCKQNHTCCTPGYRQSCPY